MGKISHILSILFLGILFTGISSSGSFAQSNQVSGTVTDANTNETLPGVNIRVKGTTNGTSTDNNGHYSLTVSSLQDTLIFSYVGFKSQTIPINGRQTININLSSQALQAQELVVVGYGEQQRSDLTGSITTVSSDEVEQVPVTDVAKALEGKVAGLNITQSSSAIPGTSPSIMVRGQNSITASNNPLIVVDGTPFSGGLNDINQNNIANISVLKGPSATAIYGTRGSNGVILIETKEGKQGEAQITYSGHSGYAELAHVLQPASPEAYLDKWKWAQLENGVPEDQLTPVPNSPGGNEYKNYQAGNTVDWLDEVTQPGYISDNNLSISGATNTISYYISGEYLKHRGAIKGYQFTRANIQAKLDADLTDYLQAGTNLFYNSNNYDGGQANLLFAEQMSPFGTLYASNGDYTKYPMDPEQLYLNPLISLNRDRISRYKRVDGKGHIIFKPGFLTDGLSFLKGLEYRLNASYTYSPARNATYVGRDAGSTANGSADLNNTSDRNWLIENLLTYKQDFGEHHIDFTGLYSAQEFKHFYSSAHANDFINDLLSYNNLGAGATQSDGSDASTYSLVSQMARLNYSYKHTYLITLTARRDGYSAFGSNTDKYGLFPSAAIGWNISNENFMQNIDAVDNLKLRFSYGKAGNQGIDPNQTTSLNDIYHYPFHGLSEVISTTHQLGNRDLQWETSTTADLGVDFGLFNDRVSGTIDLYDTDSNGLLLSRQLPAITGYSSVLQNIGEVKNQGLEISLNTVNIQKGDFEWTSDINFSTNRNKIVDLYGNKEDDLGNRWFIGEPINVIYGYTQKGVWQEDEADQAALYNAEPGDLKLADMNGDTAITAEDRSILGSPNPKWTGGLTNTFFYKNFSLKVFIQTVQGVLKYNPNLNLIDLAGRRNIPAGLGYWTPENDNNSQPALSYTNPIGYGYPRDASYTRLKNITLSYNVPKSFLDKTGLDNLTLYLSGDNLYTWTPWFGDSPEVNQIARGGNNFETNYPQERTIVFGINLTL